VCRADFIHLHLNTLQLAAGSFIWAHQAIFGNRIDLIIE
jgi:hypothetical protein